MGTWWFFIAQNSQSDIKKLLPKLKSSL